MIRRTLLILLVVAALSAAADWTVFRQSLVQTAAPMIRFAQTHLGENRTNPGIAPVAPVLPGVQTAPASDEATAQTLRPPDQAQQTPPRPSADAAQPLDPRALGELAQQWNRQADQSRAQRRKTLQYELDRLRQQLNGQAEGAANPSGQRERHDPASDVPRHLLEAEKLRVELMLDALRQK